MRTGVFLIAICCISVPSGLASGDDDPIRANLDSKIAEYQTKISSLRQKISDDFAKQDERARKRTVLDYDLIERIKAEQEAFLERGDEPSLVDRRLVRELREIQGGIERDFKEAYDAYLRDSQDAQAGRLEQEFRELLKTAPPLEPNATPLFNGTDLDAWRPEGGNNAYSILRRELVCSRPGTGRLQSVKAFSNFSLRLDYKIPRNNRVASDGTGVLLVGVGSGNRIVGVEGKGAIECRLKQGESGDLRVLAGQGDQNPRLPRTDGFRERPDGIWNALEIRFTGSDLRVYVNNTLVNTARIDYPIASHIALRNGAAICYRNIRVISPPPE